MVFSTKRVLTRARPCFIMQSQTRGRRVGKEVEMKDIEKLLNELEKRGGATLKGGKIIEHKHGYQTAYQRIIETSKKSDVIDYLNKLINEPKEWGFWMDDKGIFCLDYSKSFPKFISRPLAIYKGEQTVYEWKTGRCIDPRTWQYVD